MHVVQGLSATLDLWWYVLLQKGLRAAESQHRRFSPMEVSSEFVWNKGGVAVLAENLQYLWNGAR